MPKTFGRIRRGAPDGEDSEEARGARQEFTAFMRKYENRDWHPIGESDDN